MNKVNDAERVGAFTQNMNSRLYDSEQEKYERIWESFCKDNLEKRSAWTIREQLGSKTVKQLLEEKVLHPLFFKGIFRLFNFPNSKKVQVQNFIMTNNYIPMSQVRNEIAKITTSEAEKIQIRFKNRKIENDENFTIKFGCHGLGGEIFDVYFDYENFLNSLKESSS